VSTQPITNAGANYFQLRLDDFLGLCPRVRQERQRRLGGTGVYAASSTCFKC